MSRENVDVVRKVYRAWAAGDLWAHAEVYDPDIRYTRVMGGDDAGVGLAGEWEGMEGLVRGALLWVDAWEDLRVEAEDFIDPGDTVVALTRQTGRAKSSGVPLDRPLADVWEFRNGRVVRLTSYWNRDEALESVGLSSRPARRDPRRRRGPRSRGGPTGRPPR
jgi:ketosteroid isomerase-like protein